MQLINRAGLATTTIDILAFIHFIWETDTYKKIHENKEDKKANAQNINTGKIIFSPSQVCSIIRFSLFIH